MPRYIDADLLETEAEILIALKLSYTPYEVFNLVNKQPTVDAVKVVRCKDCVHKEREQPGMVYCPMMVGSWVAEDHFCKWGERRE